MLFGVHGDAVTLTDGTQAAAWPVLYLSPHDLGAMNRYLRHHLRMISSSHGIESADRAVPVRARADVPVPGRDPRAVCRCRQGRAAGVPRALGRRRLPMVDEGNTDRGRGALRRDRRCLRSDDEGSGIRRGNGSARRAAADAVGPGRSLRFAVAAVAGKGARRRGGSTASDLGAPAITDGPPPIRGDGSGGPAAEVRVPAARRYPTIRRRWIGRDVGRRRWWGSTDAVAPRADEAGRT